MIKSKFLPPLLIFFVASVGTLPVIVNAQGSEPIERCSITDTSGISVGRWKAFRPAGAPVFGLYRDNNSNGTWEGGERVPTDPPATAIFPPGALDENKITIPQNALNNGTAAWKDIERGDVLPPNWAIFCLMNIVDTVTDWIFTIILALAIGLIAFAGFLWATSGANPNLQKTAKSMILAAITGFIIAILAKAIPHIILGIIN